MWFFLPLCFQLVSGLGFAPLDKLRPFVPDTEQTAAVKALINRTLPNYVNQIEISVTSDIGKPNQDVVKIQIPSEDRIREGYMVQIYASTGVAAAWGVQQYLKNCCYVHFSWDGNQISSLPAKLPFPKSTQTLMSIDRFRYFANVCTFSYSMAFWDWDRWEKHIDWMALSGINMPLSFVGREAIWQKVYRKFGLSDAQILNYFTGPAFLAWNWMGNLKNWGGPLTQQWLDRKLYVQQRIIQRQIQLGMVPVLPGFSGHVPDALKTIYPSAKIDILHWGKFNCSYTCTGFLQPEDPLFARIGTAFLEAQQQAYGSLYHAYNVDLFNEMNPPSFEPDLISQFSKSVYQSLVQYDLDAIWVTQGWFLLNSKWLETGAAKAFMTAVPSGRILVLDLYSEQDPIYSKTESYYGQPFIWNMLHNFGGNHILYGKQHSVNYGISDALTFPNSTMVGTGITMEGIFQNYAIYQFLLDRSWSTERLNPQTWSETYSSNRYGQSDQSVNQFWQLLWATYYNSTYGFPGREVVFIKRPHFNLTQPSWVSAKNSCNAWNLLSQTCKNGNLTKSPLFQHDAVDFTREMLQTIFINQYQKIQEFFRSKDLDGVRKTGAEILKVLDTLDYALASIPAFRLDTWLNSARKDAESSNEANLWEFNARNQVTLWGPNGEILDYAAKQWAGLVQNYYKPRWQYFVGVLEECLTSKVGYSQKKFDAMVFEKVEWPFQRNPIKVRKGSDPIKAVQSVYSKYYDILC